MRFLAVLVLLAIFSCPLQAFNWKKFWKTTAVTLVVSNTLDLHSSYGKLEGNPIFRGADGRFGIRSAVIKLSFAPAVIWGQKRVIDSIDHPVEKRRAFQKLSLVNLGLSGLFTAVSIRNYGNPPCCR